MPPTIVVLDSGVGGLSVCQSILTLTQHVRIVYVADDAFFPYGVMEESALTDRLMLLTTRLLSAYQPALVVLACNTVSTLLLPALRDRFDVPFVGVVPAIKPAAQLSRTRVIGLLATPATICRPYTDELIASFADGCQVLRLGSRELVLEAESYLMGRGVNTEALDAIVTPLRSAPRLDTLVLGCTHFPLLRRQLSEILPGVVLVDSGEAIARRVDELLRAIYVNGELDIDQPVLHLVYFTRSIPTAVGFGEHLRDLGMTTHEFRLLN